MEKMSSKTPRAGLPGHDLWLGLTRHSLSTSSAWPPTDFHLPDKDKENTIKNILDSLGCVFSSLTRPFSEFSPPLPAEPRVNVVCYFLFLGIVFQALFKDSISHSWAQLTLSVEKYFLH
jgi:hypothetical protein